MTSYERRRAYDYRRRTKVANASEQLVAINRIIEGTDHQIADILGKDPGGTYTPYRVASLLKSMFETALRAGAGLAFLEVLREYEMTPADRKVIEDAARHFSKTRVIVKREKAIQAYPDVIDKYKNYVETAFSVLRKNEKHTDEGATTTLKVGSFTLINTGGFSDAVMAECGKVVAKSEQLLRQKGLGKVCYGDVHVTNTVHKSTRVLAFYLLNNDTLYIRANLKGKLGPALQSMIHELGHRLQHKFLQSKKRDIHFMYQALKRKRHDVFRELVMDRSQWPKPGDTYPYKGETMVFDRVDLTSRSNLKVVFRIPDPPPKFSIEMPLETYLLKKHPEMKTKASVFVTNYAATDPDENFAEMIAFYCEDKLPEDQIAMLEPIIQ